MSKCYKPQLSCEKSFCESHIKLVKIKITEKNQYYIRICNNCSNKAKSTKTRNIGLTSFGVIIPIVLIIAVVVVIFIVGG